jgi:hypothetical protein
MLLRNLGEQLIFGNIFLESKLRWRQKNIGQTARRMLYHEPTKTVLVITEDPAKKHWIHSYHSDSFEEIFCLQFSESHVPVDMLQAPLFAYNEDFQQK